MKIKLTAPQRKAIAANLGGGATGLVAGTALVKADPMKNQMYSGLAAVGIGLGAIFYGVTKQKAFITATGATCAATGAVAVASATMHNEDGTPKDGMAELTAFLPTFSGVNGLGTTEQYNDTWSYPQETDWNYAEAYPSSVDGLPQPEMEEQGTPYVEAL